MVAAGMDVIRVVSMMLLCLVTSSHGYEFFVGGQDGWIEKPKESYEDWAARIRFQVHDTLVFKYKKEAESVLEVEKEHYVKCDTSNPIRTFSDGDSKVKLTRDGAFYFISGKKSSCESGQKLHIVVLREKSNTPASSPTPHSPTVSPVPSTPSSPSPSQSPKAQTPPSPSPQPQALTPTPESPKAQPPSPKISPSPSQTPVVSPPTPSKSPSSSPTSSPPEPLTPPAPPSEDTSPSPSSDDDFPESDSPAPPPEDSSAYAITSSTVLTLGISLFLGVTLNLF